ncbi:MAG: ferrous iron transport protein B [Bacteroidales bacterium]|nr:ferrous iron transport protein B [Bacteroidales bacterium]
MTLNDLHTGESGIIVRIHGRGAFRKRITEMGFVKGKPVTVIKAAPLRDPVEFRILDSNVSLRRSEAQLIEVINDSGMPLHPEYHEWKVVHSGAFHRPELHNHGQVINIALVGNPNSGKTTLFNRLSRSREHVGNYPGVTVGSKLARFHHRGYTFNITDLPGTYSLSDYSEEELVVRDHIMKNRADIVVNVIDASNLERNLYLTSQLIDMDITVVVALNMYDDLLTKGDQLDIDQLSRLLGVRIVPTIGTRGKGVPRLLNHIIRVYEGKDPAIRHIKINYGHELEQSITAIEDSIRQISGLTDRFSPRFVAIKMLEKDQKCRRLISGVSDSNAIREQAGEEITKLENLYREDTETQFADARYGFIEGALRETLKRSGQDPGLTRSQRIDRLLTHKYLGFPVFLAFLYIMFQATFSLGKYPMQWIESGVALLGQFVEGLLPQGILADLLIDGIIGGVGGVIVFLPNILILFLFISIMEDTGYMARTAFIMDRVMHLFGLHGKSFIPLIMGFGCNVPAIMATRVLENRNDRLLTMLIIPFMSCSARLPVYILIAGALFPSHAGNVIFGLYMVGIAVSLLMAILFKNTLFRNKEAPFVMELPVYRRPGVRLVLRHMWFKGGEYLKKMGGVILIASIVIWALGYFPREMKLDKDYAVLVAEAGSAEEIERVEAMMEAERQEQSYIGRIGQFIEPVIRPLGFDWKMGVSLVSGFAAKEVVVSTMGVLYQVDDGYGSGAPLQQKLQQQVYTSGPRAGQKVYTPLSGLSFLLFVLLYFPCIAVVTAVGREAGSWKWSAFVIFYTTALAWLASFLFYQGGSLLGWGWITEG